ncbi:YbhB/YbcL family Raf kinase inhibitor-like protein [Dyella humi]
MRIPPRTSLLLAMLMLYAGSGYASPPQASLHVSSSSFTDGGKMPSKLTCDGENLSPQIQLPSPPAGTKSFAIVMDDPDAPIAFAHWLVYGIPADTRELAEGASTASRRLDHAVEGVNSFGRTGYGGPCPPEGKPHHYVLRVYALDVMSALPTGASADQVNAAIQGHVLAEGRTTGLYARGGD